MTTADSMLPAEAREGSPFAEREGAQTRFGRFEHLLTTASEYLNPILVKETRQALKSWQFVIAFTLLLLVGWGWSLLYLSLKYSEIGQGIFYAPQGAPMLAGYYCILAFFMVVIVPFVAFRSLSAEREDGTYELVSITALSARQIVGGKLGSAILQMLIYLSALAPGMAFTYLLRGVDVVLILMTCLYLFLGSVLLSLAGLVLATVTTSRLWQMVLGVLFILGLAVLFLYSAVGGAFGITQGAALPYDEMFFWVGQLAFLTAYACYSVQLFLAAAARITFVSENRSTALRIGMAVMQVLCIGWVSWHWLVLEERYALYFLLIWAAIHWWLMGSLLVGESDELSLRVRRSLPASFLGRMFFTWLNPGPGTGFMFTFTNAFALLLVVIAMAIFSNAYPFAGRLQEEQVLFALFAFCYVVIYVGGTRLLMLLMDRVVHAGVFLSLLVSLLLVLLGTFVPLVGQGFVIGMMRTRMEYTAFQVSNPFWTLLAIEENDLTELPMGGFSIPLEAILLVLAAGGMLLVNMLLAAREVDRQREAAPQRVIEDEAALHPEKIAKPAPTSPWDDGQEVPASTEPQQDEASTGE